MNADEISQIGFMIKKMQEEFEREHPEIVKARKEREEKDNKRKRVGYFGNRNNRRYNQETAKKASIYYKACASVIERNALNGVYFERNLHSSDNASLLKMDIFALEISELETLSKVVETRINSLRRRWT